MSKLLSANLENDNWEHFKQTNHVRFDLSTPLCFLQIRFQNREENDKGGDLGRPWTKWRVLDVEHDD